MLASAAPCGIKCVNGKDEARGTSVMQGTVELPLNSAIFNSDDNTG